MLFTGTAEDIAVIVRVQAIVRGFIERRKYRVKVSDFQMNNCHYFKKEELMETI